jgi:hypothetical protein
MSLFSQKEKKIQFEFSIGAARVNPASIYQRPEGLDALINQYAQYYQADYSVTGGFSENKFFIPFSFSANYRINDSLYIKAGVDYITSSTSDSEKSFQVTWNNFFEQYDYLITDKLSYFMPHIGVGFRKDPLSIYGAVGIGMAQFTHTEDIQYSESPNGYSYDIEDSYKIKGTAPGIIIGFKYSIPLRKKGINPFVKLEAVLLKVKKFTGTKTTVSSDSLGETFSQTQDGTLYEFEWNPYRNQRFDYWDVYDTLPDDPTKLNFREMGINLSGIRLMIGISF